jgi:hypothetical protein
MEEAKEVHTCLKKAGGIFHYVKVRTIFFNKNRSEKYSVFARLRSLIDLSPYE